jgi:hypothetical protein
MVPCTVIPKRAEVLSYAAFGLSLASDRPVPGLAPSTSHQPVDTRIWLDTPIPFEPQHDSGHVWYTSDESGRAEPALRVFRTQDTRYFTLRYRDGTTFVVNRDATDVWASWPESSTLEDTATYLLGPILGFVLRLRGCSCLHASAVAIGGCAVALMGPAGAGKSTTAAAMGLLGHPLVTEDVVALEDTGHGFSVRPGYPQVRLWPDSVRLLCGDGDALPRLTPTWDKRALDFTRLGLRFHSRPLPLRAVYLLCDAQDSDVPSPDSNPGDFVALHGADSMLALLSNTYVGYLLDANQRAEEFATLARLAALVPLRRAVISAAESPASFCARLIRDLGRL